MHGESGVETGKARNKMVFPDANGPFSCVLPMVVRRDELESDIVGAEELLQGGGAFIVQFL